MFKRYSDPFSLLNCYIQSNRLPEFIDEILNIDDEDRLFQVWLHKEWEVSWIDYLNMIKSEKVKIENSKITTSELETTIQDSIDILNSFKPI